VSESEHASQHFLRHRFLATAGQIVSQFRCVDTLVHERGQLRKALPQLVGGIDAVKIVEAMKAKTPGVWVPLEGKSIRHLERCKANAEVTLQQKAIGMADREIFGMMRNHARVLQCLEKLFRPQRKSAVTDLVAGWHPGPHGADIVVLEKDGLPVRGIQHESVPLNDQREVGFDIGIQALHHEFVVAFDRVEAFKRDHFDLLWNRRGLERHLIGSRKDEISGEFAARTDGRILNRAQGQARGATVDADQRYARESPQSALCLGEIGLPGLRRRGRRFAPRAAFHNDQNNSMQDEDRESKLCLPGRYARITRTGDAGVSQAGDLAVTTIIRNVQPNGARVP